MKKIVFIIAVIITTFAIIQAPSVSAISDSQKTSISDYCETIRGNLSLVSHEDSRARAYIGAYYETILSKYMTPFSLRLIKNNLIEEGITQNKIDFANQKNKFTNDFKTYQDSLYELIDFDCKNHPEEFYEKLEKVREKRELVHKDITKLNSYIKDHKSLVNKFEESL